MKIGVFDSGVGGLSVAQTLSRELPDHEIIFVNDTKNVPYGTKQPAEIYGLISPIFQDLERQNCDVVVVACNTVSTTLIEQLRQDYKTPLIAVEPMVKPAAAMSATGVIAVCATPGTLNSDRYAFLKATYAANTRIVEPDCSNWSYLIENNQMNDAIIRACIEPALDQGADVVVLGCTHYHWIETEIKAIAAGRAVVLQPEQAVLNQVKRVLRLVV